MNIELKPHELEMIAKALAIFANDALEHNADRLVAIEIYGRMLCTKFLNHPDISKGGSSIESAFEAARECFCGIADDAALGAAGCMGMLDEDNLKASCNIIKDKKQAEAFAANYKKILNNIKANMEPYK